MSAQVVDISGGESVVSEGLVIDRPLEWYKIVAIELVLFVGTLVPVLYGALIVR